MTLGALLGIKLQYSNDDLIAHNKYVSGKRSVALSLNRCHKLFPVFSLLCPIFTWSFSILSGSAADKPTGLQTCFSRSETINSGWAPLGEEPEPLWPLGNTSDKLD